MPIGIGILSLGWKGLPIKTKEIHRLFVFFLESTTLSLVSSGLQQGSLAQGLS